MKRQFAVLSFLICMAAGLPFASAQSVNFGFNGGLILSSISSDDSYHYTLADGRDVTLGIHDDNYTGYHFGAFAEVSLLSFFLQPGLTYTKTGQDMTLEYTIDGATRSQDLTSEFSHLKLPVMAGTEFTIARVAVGPVFSVLLNESGDTIDDFESSDLHYSNASVGYQLMAGLKYARFTLDYRFEGNFTSLGDNISLGDQNFDFDTHPRQHFLTLGIILF